MVFVDTTCNSSAHRYTATDTYCYNMAGENGYVHETDTAMDIYLFILF